ncbi:MAG: MFS transporter [Clostridiales bacterium]|nr:MFS transporter [Clostridiales bacterium]
MNKTIENKSKTPMVLVLIILLLTAVAAPLNLNKVSPIAPELMQYFKIGETQLGMLISVFSLTGIILALPGGLLIHKFGPWKCILVSLLSLLIGSIIGTYSDSFALLLISRIIEGMGMALIAVAGPSIISTTVNPGRRGIAMGFFSSYIGIGQVLTYNLAPQIIISKGWRGVWRFSTLYTAIFAVIWILLMFKINAFSQKQSPMPISDTQNIYAFSVLKNRSLWYLFISMGLYVISYAIIQMFLPIYLSDRRSIEMAYASSLVSITCFLGTISSLIAGIISDKLGSRRVLGGVCLIVSASLFALIPFIPTSSFILLIIILGFIPPILPVCAFAAATEVIDNISKSGIAMGLICMGQNIGFVVGPTLFGAIVQEYSWNAAFFFTVPVAVTGGLFMLLNKKVR